MRSLLLRMAVLTLVIVIVLTTSAIMVGKLFPSKWVFTVISNPSRTLNRHYGVLLVDAERGHEVLMTSTFFQPDLSRDGDFVYWTEYVSEDSNIFSIMNLRSGQSAQFELAGGGNAFLSSLSPANAYLYANVGGTMYRIDLDTLTIETAFPEFNFSEYRTPVQVDDILLLPNANGDFYGVDAQNPDGEVTLLYSSTASDVVGDYSAIGGFVMPYGNEIQLIDLYTGEILETFTGIEEDIQYLVWSPDGQWLTIYADPISQEMSDRRRPQKLYTLDVATGTVYPIELAETSEDHIDGFNLWATWSPDSDYLGVVESNSANNRVGHIYVMIPTGDNRQVITSQASMHSFRWLSDSRSILYFEEADGGNLQLRRADIGEPEVESVVLDAGDWSISAIIEEESWVIYRRDTASEDGIYLLNYETGEGRYLFSPEYTISTFRLWD